MGTLLRSAVVLALLAAAARTPAFTRDSLVWQKCTGCHAPGADGRIARVEELRTTPEEWTVIVDRMRRLHGMRITVADMDRLLKELCATQLLTPGEQAEVSYLSLFHNSQRVETPSGPQEERLFAACVRCHSAGKIRSYRMTEASWAKLRDFHHFVDPAVIFQMREMHWRDEADAVLKDLARAQPYGQPWSAPAAKLEGEWLVLGYEPGRGAYRGEARITGGADGEYRITGKLRHAGRAAETFAGEATLYGGYALRTRTHHGGAETRGAYIVSGDRIEGEHHFPAPHFRTSRATWIRKDGVARVARVTPGFLLSGETTTLTVEGVELPSVTPADVTFAGGKVKVLAARRAGPDAVELKVVADAKEVGAVRLTVKGLEGGSVVVAPAIDHIAIEPQMGRARLAGGPAYPAEGVQFEAIAYARRSPGAQGAQGAPASLKEEPHADVALGPVPASFVLAEEKTRDGDDDVRWVSRIGANGSYVPKGTYSPLPGRTYSTEASGLVKVVATYRRGGKAHRAEAQLAVTVPDLIQRIR